MEHFDFTAEEAEALRRFLQEHSNELSTSAELSLFQKLGLDAGVFMPTTHQTMEWASAKAVERKEGA